MTPEFSFIVPVFNGEVSLADTLLSIGRQKGNFEIIVIDNNSTDRTRLICLDYKNVRYHTCLPQGRSYARNEGARLAQGKFLAFVDCDVVLDDNWLSSVEAFLGSCPVDAVVTSIVPKGSSRGGIVDEYRSFFGNYKSFGTYLSLHKPYGVKPVINTAACVVSKRAFEACHGFNKLLSRNEDLDFSFRLFLSGHIIGGTVTAKANVYFPGSWRTLGYIKREFYVRYNALLKEKVFGHFQIDLLRACFRKGSLKLVSFAFILSIVSTIARLMRVLNPRHNDLLRQALQSWIITFKKINFLLSFDHKGKSYCLIEELNLVIIDSEVYFLNRYFQTKATFTGMNDLFIKLVSRSEMIDSEKERMIKTGLFVSV